MMLTGMAYSTDRMRFKDKIIANIAKAIKGIQEAVFYRNRAQPEDSTLVLRNNDRECHKLCENLDHVFLHGLRHVTNGYWKVITEFTRKDAVKEIQNFSNITTDLGRGRAWIFMALNECLLESYIRNISGDARRLKKYYVKEALLLDQQQMSVLLTLTSGLECVVFKLECDLPYLDLSAYPPRTRTASELEEEDSDHISHHSVSSFSSRHNSETAASTPESVKALTDSDTSSLSSLDAGALRQSFNRISSISADSGFPGDIISLQGSKQRSTTPTDTISISSHGSGGEPDRLTRLESLVKDVEETDGGGLEVIRVRGGKKSSVARKKKKVDKKNNNEGLKLQGSNASGSQNSLREMGSSGAGDDVFASENPHTSENLVLLSDSYVLELENKQQSSDLEVLVNSYSTITSRPSDGTDGAGTLSVKNTIDNNEDGPYVAEQREEKILNNVIPGTVDAAKVSADICKEKSLSGIQNKVQFVFDSELSSQLNPDKLLVTCSEKSHTSESAQVNKDTCDTNCNPSFQQDQGLSQTQPLQNVEHKHAFAVKELESKCAEFCRPVEEGPEENNSTFNSKLPSMSASYPKTVSNNWDAHCAQKKDYEHGLFVKENGDLKTEIDTEQDEEQEADFYGDSSPAHVSSPRTHSFSQLQDYVDYISGSHEDHLINEVDAFQRSVGVCSSEDKSGITWTKEYALKLDNNTKLQIMLDVFRHDDEEFFKMFVTREGHTEGDIRIVYVLVTNYMFYLLYKKDRKFVADFAIQLKDLSFVSLSLNKQMLHIESTGSNRKKERIWLTPGDQILAQEMVDCLEAAVKNVLPITMRACHFSTASDDPTDAIALRKYISHECRCEDDNLEDYSLVFWEDAQARKTRSTSVTREGTLLQRILDPFKGHKWKTVFVVLRDFMLCIFDNKTDSKPQQYLCLGGEQCVGCRLETLPDRPYCIEIILAKGGSWYLSAGSEEDASSWRQALCLAVSEGLQQNNATLSCLPCVSVVTPQKLLLCHEDVQTRFFRTIASAKVEEVTALILDPDYKTYCIVEFESQEQGVSSEQWVFYFNTPLELDRFTTALGKVWRQSYQVPLSPGAIDNLLLQRHCQEQVEILQKDLDQKR